MHRPINTSSHKSPSIYQGRNAERPIIEKSAEKSTDTATILEEDEEKQIYGRDVNDDIEAAMDEHDAALEEDVERKEEKQ